jgi:phage-related minor tail protein
MSGGIKGITIEIGGDTTKLGQAIGDSEKKTRSLQVELRQVEKLLKLDPTNVELLSQKQEILTQSVGETSKKLDLLKEAEKQVTEQFKRGEVSEEQVRALQREIIKTEKALDDMKSELTSTEKAMKDLADGTDNAEKHTEEYKKSVEDAKKELEEFKGKASEAFDTLKTGAVAAGAAIVATAGYALKLSTDFDKATNTLITKTGASADEIDELNTAMENVYRNNFGESIEDVANAMATVRTNTKLAGEELQATTEYAILLRDTFEFEVNESTRSAKMLMDQYGLSAKEAYNLIAQGAQKGLDKNGDLLDTINEYAVHFNGLGISANEMFNMLANGADAGTFSVDKLGDAIKEFGIRVKDGTADEAFVALGLAIEDVSKPLGKAKENVAKYEKTVKDLQAKLSLTVAKQKEFNKSTKDATKLKVAQDIEKYSRELETAIVNLNGAKSTVAQLTEVATLSGRSANDLKKAFVNGGAEAKQALKEVTSALFAMEDPVKQNALGVQMFGTMWEDLGVDGVKAIMDMTGEIDVANTALDDINNQKYDDIGSAIAGLGRIIETDVVKPLGEELKPVVEDIIGTVQDNAPQIKSFLADVVEKIGEFVNLVVNNGGTIASLIGGIGTGFAAWKVGALILGVVKAIKAFKLANEEATVSQIIFNGVLKTNPIVLIISLIAGLVAAFILLWNNCEGFRKFWINLWENIKIICKAVGDWLVQAWADVTAWFSQTWVDVSNFVVDSWDKITSKVASGIDYIKSIFSTVANWVNTTVIQPITGFFSNLWNGFKNGAVNAWEGVKSVFSAVGEFFGSIFNTVKEKILAVFSAGGNIFSGIKDGIVSTFKTVVNAIIRGINKVITIPFNGLNGVLKKISRIDILGVTPFSWLTWRAPVPQIPLLARGGVLKKGQVGLLEGSGAEAVVPLEHNTEWLNKIAQRLNQNTQVPDNGEVLTALDRIYDRLNRLQVVLNNGALVGEILDDIDAGLADKQLLNARGV